MYKLFFNNDKNIQFLIIYNTVWKREFKIDGIHGDWIKIGEALTD